ncbi:hypothetical protein B0H14DRAFT_2561806 [Mycena olivaceomarginata]|nr:hypothetical protein B0H14DRAFT_2561806 [Mycena olivaceomarginata]
MCSSGSWDYCEAYTEFSENLTQKTLEGWDEKTRGMGKSEFNLVQDIRRLLHIPHIFGSVQVDHGIPTKHIIFLPSPSELASRFSNFAGFLRVNLGMARDHVPSTNRYTASAMLMLANNIWVENLALEAPVELFRACARFAASEAQEVFHNLKPTDPSKTATCVADDTSEIVAAAGPSTVIESQTPISAQPPQKQLNLGPLKGWGVQHDGVSLSTVYYAQNHRDKFNEEYPEYAKAVLPADSDEYITVEILGTFQTYRTFPVTRLSVTTHVPAMTPSSFCVQRINLQGQNPSGVSIFNQIGGGMAHGLLNTRSDEGGADSRMAKGNKKKRERKRVPKEERKNLRLWAEGARETILTPHLDNYQTALNQGWRRERKYLKKVCREYNARVSWRTLDHEEPVLAEWDPAALIVDEQLSDDEEEARAARVKILNARIRRWFTYRLRKINKQRSGALDPTKDPYAVLLAKLSGLTAPPKARQAYQQFMRESYAEKIAPVVAEEWQKLQEKDSQLSAGTKEPKAGFRAQVAREVFADLPSAEKKDIAARATGETAAAKLEYVNALKGPVSTSPEARQKCIDAVGRFMGPILSGLNQHTGLHATLILGGPMPKYGGELQTVHTADAVHWPQWDKTRFAENVNKFMINYLATAFYCEISPAGLCASRIDRPERGQNTPSRPSTGAGESESESDSDDSEDDSDLDSQSGSDTDEDEDGRARKKQKMGTEKRKAKKPVKARTATVATSSASAAAPPTGSPPAPVSPAPTSPVPAPVSTAPASATAPSGSSDVAVTARPQPRPRPKKAAKPIPAVPMRKSTRGKGEAGTAMDVDPAEGLDTGVMDAATSGNTLPPTLSTAASANVSYPTVTGAPSATSAPVPSVLASGPPSAPSAVSRPTTAVDDTGNPTPNPTPSEDTSTALTLPPLSHAAHDAIGPNTQTTNPSPTPTSTSTFLPCPPQAASWFADAHAAMTKVDLGCHYHALVAAWTRIEQASRFEHGPTNLSPKGRPKQVTAWINRLRKGTEPVFDDPETYAIQWQQHFNRHFLIVHPQFPIVTNGKFTMYGTGHQRADAEKGRSAQSLMDFSTFPGSLKLVIVDPEAQMATMGDIMLYDNVLFFLDAPEHLSSISIVPEPCEDAMRSFLSGVRNLAAPNRRPSRIHTFSRLSVTLGLPHFSLLTSLLLAYIISSRSRNDPGSSEGGAMTMAKRLLIIVGILLLSGYNQEVVIGCREESGFQTGQSIVGLGSTNLVCTLQTEQNCRRPALNVSISVIPILPSGAALHSIHSLLAGVICYLGPMFMLSVRRRSCFNPLPLHSYGNSGGEDLQSVGKGVKGLSYLATEWILCPLPRASKYYPSRLWTAKEGTGYKLNQVN